MMASTRAVKRTRGRSHNDLVSVYYNVAVTALLLQHFPLRNSNTVNVSAHWGSHLTHYTRYTILVSSLSHCYSLKHASFR